MHLFDSFIARGDCLEDLGTILRHPNVKHLIRLPRDWVFYEFHHDLFKDPDFLVEGVWREKMERFPEIRRARVEMLNQERALLAPWYAKKKKLGDADALLASEICSYRISSLAPMRWIDFLPDAGWGSAAEFTITLEPVGAALPPVAYQLLEEWATCGRAAGELTPPSSLRTTTEPLVLPAQCSYYSGHWLVILWVLLSDARWNAGLSRMRIAVSEPAAAH